MRVKKNLNPSHHKLPLLQSKSKVAVELEKITLLLLLELPVLAVETLEKLE
jgi:hypothetical protein